MTLPGFTRPDRGVLFVVSGPSGVGKSTLIATAMEDIADLAFSVSATTRAPRGAEVDGVDYHFLTREAFGEKVASGAFLEHATVYEHAYGTLREPTEEALSGGSSLILDIDVQGAKQIRDQLPEAVHIFIVPPDLGLLEARLQRRGTDGAETIGRRMAQVGEQLRGVDAFDYLVVNDDLDTARRVFTGILLAEMSRRSRRASLVRRIIDAAG